MRTLIVSAVALFAASAPLAAFAAAPPSVPVEGHTLQIATPDARATRPGAVTVAGRPGVDVPPGTLTNIWRQTGMREES